MSKRWWPLASRLLRLLLLRTVWVTMAKVSNGMCCTINFLLKSHLLGKHGTTRHSVIWSILACVLKFFSKLDIFDRTCTCEQRRTRCQLHLAISWNWSDRDWSTFLRIYLYWWVSYSGKEKVWLFYDVSCWQTSRRKMWNRWRIHWSQSSVTRSTV